MPEEPVDRSYRALFRVPGLGRVVTSMTLARIAQSMVGVAIVLFVLVEYHSPTLAGIVTFASIFPGLLIAPIAGALLDRHGRVRLMILDYVVALVSLTLIGGLALAGLLPPWLLVAHHDRDVADEHPVDRRPADPLPDHGPVRAVGAGQRGRLERLRGRHDPRPAPRRRRWWRSSARPRR